MGPCLDDVAWDPHVPHHSAIVGRSSPSVQVVNVEEVGVCRSKKKRNDAAWDPHMLHHSAIVGRSSPSMQVVKVEDVRVRVVIMEEVPVQACSCGGGACMQKWEGEGEGRSSLRKWERGGCFG